MTIVSGFSFAQCVRAGGPHLKNHCVALLCCSALIATTAMIMASYASAERRTKVLEIKAVQDVEGTSCGQRENRVPAWVPLAVTTNGSLVTRRSQVAAARRKMERSLADGRHLAFRRHRSQFRKLRALERAEIRKCSTLEVLAFTTPVPTSTATSAPTPLSTLVAPTLTPSALPTGSGIGLTATPTAIPLPTLTPTTQATVTTQATATSVPTLSVPVASATATGVPSLTPTPTCTMTPGATATVTATPEPTATALPTETPQPLSTVTSTPLPISTSTPTPLPTSTALATVSPTPVPTATFTPTAVPLPTVAPTTPPPTITPLPTAIVTPGLPPEEVPPEFFLGNTIVASNGTLLGKFLTSTTDPESINNPNGLYGSRFTPNSILNRNGIYGSLTSIYSPFNVTSAASPPRFGFYDDIDGEYFFFAGLTNYLGYEGQRVDPCDLLAYLGRAGEREDVCGG